MLCPHCQNPIPDSAVMSAAASINGKKSKRTEVPRCKRHGVFLHSDGSCPRCLHNAQIIHKLHSPNKGENV